MNLRLLFGPALLAMAGAIATGGCASTVVRNRANTECQFRVDTDKARCLRNNKSSDDAMATGHEASREPKEAWADQTTERIDALGGK